VRAWPMCRAPVTFGGGRTTTNEGFELEAASGTKKPDLSHQSYHDFSTWLGLILPLHLSRKLFLLAKRSLRTHPDIEGNVPFLVMNKEKRMMLFPLFFLLEKAPDAGNFASWCEVPCASAQNEWTFNKWVHVGCEVPLTSIRLYIDGELEGEKSFLSSLENDSKLKDLKGVTLGGTDAENGRLQGYVRYIRFILPQKSAVEDHFVKNPPIELSIDTAGITEIEEDGDGIWSIIGGKASCRKNFNLDVVLLDGLGHPVNKEMEVVASLIYADNGNPVENPTDADAPLLTSYDGIEFASSQRPSKLLHGRASFKLKISQSGKLSGLTSPSCKRLKLVILDFVETGLDKVYNFQDSDDLVRSYPFLEAYTKQIRCVSRTHNTRTSSVMGKKSSSAVSLLYEPQFTGFDDGSPEAQQSNGDGELLKSAIQGSNCSPPPKRVKLGYAYGEGVKGKVENLEGTDNTPSDSESVRESNSAIKKVGATRNPIPDLTIFKCCLGGINERHLLLKEVAAFATDLEMTNFAQQVSFYTGCSHHWYPILIANQLLKEGSDAWDLISRGNTHVLWVNAIVEIGELFTRISHCSSRCLINQDLSPILLVTSSFYIDSLDARSITRENFDRMWCWLYLVAFTLSRKWINAIWGCVSSMWIEGLITKEHAEFSLRGLRGIHEPGTFMLRFPTSRSWPHPDAGSLIVTSLVLITIFIIGCSLLIIEDIANFCPKLYIVPCQLRPLDGLHLGRRIDREVNAKSLQELIMEEPHLTRLGRVTRDFSELA
ncbi:hypothetical protein IFM89_026345, partial [Coptis chinensis]